MALVGNCSKRCVACLLCRGRREGADTACASRSGIKHGTGRADTVRYEKAKRARARAAEANKQSEHKKTARAGATSKAAQGIKAGLSRMWNPASVVRSMCRLLPALYHVRCTTMTARASFRFPSFVRFNPARLVLFRLAWVAGGLSWGRQSRARATLTPRLSRQPLSFDGFESCSHRNAVQ